MRTTTARWRAIPTRPLLAVLILITMVLTLVAMHAATEQVAAPHHAQQLSTVAALQGADNVLQAGPHVAPANPEVAAVVHHSEADGAGSAGSCALLWMLCVLGVIAVLLVVALRFGSRMLAVIAAGDVALSDLLARLRDRLPSPPSLCALSVCRR